jgi:Ca-activated chloride channel family protein
VSGLTASDFTLLEAGKPQKIAFFSAESQPVSIAILVDASRSMDFGGKMARARAMLAALLKGNRPEDEIFLVPFSERVGSFRQLSPEERLRPPNILPMGNRGSALYDALASTLCHMRTAKNIRQAVVVITDGVDLDSRLKLEQLTDLVRSSSPQVFTIGLYDQAAYRIYQEGRKTVTLTGLREIDNPVRVFQQLAAESGAEAFFPSSDQDYKKALERISDLMKGEYTLAYYPQETGRIRKVEVKVRGSGLRISARRTVGAAGAGEAVHFDAGGCTVPPKEYPLPWESRVTSNGTSSQVYREDFSDPQSGWPNHHDKATSAHYVTGGYQVSRLLMPGSALDRPVEGVISDPADSVVAAYGPWWSNFRASAQVDALWGPPNAVGLVFDVNESGYYALLFTPPMDGRLAFELVEGHFDGTRTEIIPPTPIAALEGSGKHKLTVECNRGRIAVFVDDRQVGSVQDAAFEYGMVGFGVFGTCGGAHECRMVASKLLVESIP